MNKTELLAALAAAGVTADPAMTVKQLQDLAKQHNVPTTKNAAPGAGAGGSGNENPGGDGSGNTEQEKPTKETAPTPAGESDDEIIARKVAAGLTESQAREVLKNQRLEDSARAARK